MFVTLLTFISLISHVIRLLLCVAPLVTPYCFHVVHIDVLLYFTEVHSEDHASCIANRKSQNAFWKSRLKRKLSCTIVMKCNIILYSPYKTVRFHTIQNFASPFRRPLSHDEFFDQWNATLKSTYTKSYVVQLTVNVLC